MAQSALRTIALGYKDLTMNQYRKLTQGEAYEEVKDEEEAVEHDLLLEKAHSELLPLD